MSTNILLIGVHTWRNLGDRALSEAALKQLHANFPGCRISVAINDLESYAGQDNALPSIFWWVTHSPKHQALRFIWLVFSSILASLIHRLTGLKITHLVPSPLQRTMEAYFKADLVVCAPGGYFFSYGSGSAFIVTVFSMALALFNRKPLYFLPQSFGPLHRAREKIFARFIFNRARLVMAREPISMETLLHLGVSPERCKLLPDIAFTFQAEPVEVAQEWLLKHDIDPRVDRPLLGMTVMDWRIQDPSFSGQDNYEVALEAIIRHFASHYGGLTILFPQTSGPSTIEDDRLVTQRLAKRLSELGNSLSVIDEPLTPGLLQTVLGQLDLFIGTRMHSNIFALNSGVPVIAIGYMHKTRGIARSLGIENWVLDIDQVNNQALIGLFDDLWNQRFQVRAYLKNTILITCEQASQAGKLVAADFLMLHAKR